MKFRRARGSTVVISDPRQANRNVVGLITAWVRRGILVAIVLGIAYWFFIDKEKRITADGLVVADPVAVSPIRHARVTRVAVSCDTEVFAGDILYDVEFALPEDIPTSALERREERILQAEAIVERARSNLRRAQEESAAARRNVAIAQSDFDAHDRLLNAGALARGDWRRARAALEEAKSEELLRKRNSDIAARELSSAEARMEEEEARAREWTLLEQRARALERNGVITAPVDGTLIGCDAQLGETMLPGTAMASVFDPRRAYVLAFFPVSSANRITPGLDVSVEIHGIPAPVSGRIEALRPEVRELPEELRRFFWEAPQWSQFVPAKIALVITDARDFKRLRFASRARITASPPSSTGLGDWFDTLTGGNDGEQSFQFGGAN